MGMVVRAKRPGGQIEGETGKAVGYYDLKRRYDGDEFELLEETHFSKTWMEVIGEAPVPAPTTVSQKTAKQALSRAHTQAMKSVTGGD